MERTIGVVTEESRGVFSRISGLMERRGFQVRGMTAGATHRPGMGRYTLVIGGDEGKGRQAMRQLMKMVEARESPANSTVPKCPTMTESMSTRRGSIISAPSAGKAKESIRLPLKSRVFEYEVACLGPTS